MRHGLRNALIPVVTLIGIDFGTVIGAAVLTETVFSWPGLGHADRRLGRQRDLPVILGLTLVVVISTRSSTSSSTCRTPGSTRASAWS